MSEIEPCTELSGEDYLIIDQLDDLFVLEPNPIQSLQSALEIILNSFNRSSGVLFIQWQQGFTLPYWFQYNIPIHWQIQLDDPDSQLNKLTKNAIKTRKVLAVDTFPDISAVFPINFKDQCIGALLVWGNAISQKEYPKWLAYLKPIARAMLTFQLSESRLRSQDLLALQSITDLPTDKLELTTQVSRLKRSVADLEAKRLEILNSRNTLRVFFDNIAASVYIIDQSYLMVAINISRSKRANHHPKDLVGKKCYIELFSRSDPCPGCRVFETFNTGTTTMRSSREWLDQEKHTDWEITTFPIQDDTQLPHQVIIFEVDVTEKRSLETNLIQSEKLAAVGQLAAGVAHEINNPLAAIIANAQILQREMSEGNPETKESLKLIETAGLRASQVVSNLLGLAYKEKKYEFESFSLNETIESALSLVKYSMANRSIKVELELGETMPEIIASKSHLQGVWINLIINSMDAIQRPDGKISIKSSYDNKEFRVTIADNGKGIPGEQLSRIFEPFFTTKSAGKGTGLGLSVCMSVIKEHLGDIQVESQPEQGTKFTVILPDINRYI